MQVRIELFFHGSPHDFAAAVAAFDLDTRSQQGEHNSVYCVITPHNPTRWQPVHLYTQSTRPPQAPPLTDDVNPIYVRFFLMGVTATEGLIVVSRTHKGSLLVLSAPDDLPDELAHWWQHLYAELDHQGWFEEEAQHQAESKPSAVSMKRTSLKRRLTKEQIDALIEWYQAKERSDNITDWCIRNSYAYTTFRSWLKKAAAEGLTNLEALRQRRNELD